MLKKQTGLAKGAYATLDPETGELIQLQQPYAVMSLRTAIGRTWIEKYHGDIYNADKDAIRYKGKALRPPKYYDKIYDTINSTHMEKIKALRIEKHEPETENERRAREQITRARIIQRTQI